MTESHTLMFFSVSTPPLPRRPVPIPDDTDANLPQTNSSKGSRKKAPIPPKRTSSFKDQSGRPSNKGPPTRDITLPETVVETETQTDTTSPDNTPEELDSIDSVLDREFQFLNDTARSGSSSDEKLSSTPGSSLERGLDPRIVARSRSRSSSRERSLSESSPAKTSSEQKTPDTDISESSLPLPPPPPPAQLEKMMMMEKVPFRASLRKTKAGERIRKSSDFEEGSKSDTGDETQTVASLEESNVRQVISRYGTIPKGARIGAYLASLENNKSQSTNNEIDNSFPSPTKERVGGGGEDTGHMPTPEVARKVEEWRAGVERSMAEERAKDSGKDSDKDSGNSTEHNVKPSAIFRSSSIHTMSVASGDTKPPLSALFQRQKSDLSSPGAGGNKGGPPLPSQPPPPRDSQPHGSPVPEWKRAKPKPSPRIQPRRLRTVGDDPPDNKPEKTTVSVATVHMFPPRNPSSSSEEVIMECKSLDLKDQKSVGEYVSTENFRNKLSPPVPKKPGFGQANVPTPETPVYKWAEKVDRDGGGRNNSTDQSQNSSSNSVIDQVSKDRSKAPWEKGSPVGKLDVVNQLRLSSLTIGASTTDNAISSTKSSSSKPKFPFVKQDSTEGKDKSKSKESKSKISSTSTDSKTGIKDKSPTSGTQGAGARAVLPGARQVLPGSKKVLPTLSAASTNAPSPSSITQQRAQRPTLHRVNSDKDKTSPAGDGEAISKTQLQTLSKKLNLSLEALNSTASKHTSNFMHLSEEVQSFYDACSSYVESLPPHGKFHFRELMTTLQSLAESLKTCSGSNVREYDKLLGRLQTAIKDIDVKLSR